MRQRVLVAMSGGVDSSVAALVLEQAGHEVIGLFMNLTCQGDGSSSPAGPRACCSLEDAAAARRVAGQLGIPFHSLDLTEEFAAIRLEFLEEYRRGRTPVPCILCNRDLKLGRLLTTAEQLGATRVATGHYARLEGEGGKVPALCRARSRRDDQTYFLWALSRRGLQQAIFPLGELDKDQVRNRAREAGLETAARPSSQDLCFVPGGDYVTALRGQGAELQPGPVVDLQGRVLGQHGGIETVTVGQRHGLGIATGAPCYVVEIQPVSGTVVVGPREALRAVGLEASGVIWGGEVPPAGEVTGTMRIRHRAAEHPARVLPLPGGRMVARFDSPVEGVAPGQAAVLYSGERVLCGGWIDSPLR